jgi:hypothetical protein
VRIQPEVHNHCCHLLAMLYAFTSLELCGSLTDEALHACCSAAVKFRAEEAVTNYALTNYSQELEHFDEVRLMTLPSCMRRLHSIATPVYNTQH